MALLLVRWAAALFLAFAAGKLMTKMKMPAILGWLLGGMVLGPHGLSFLPQSLMDMELYKTVICWMQVSFGLMLGTELVWRQIRKYGKALIITTLTQSLGTFALVSIAFLIVFLAAGIPAYLAFAFGGIALATAPAPALSISREFHTRGPVTDTLLPMAVLDDIVGIAVFFTVNSCIAHIVSGGSVSVALIPVMIFLPIAVGVFFGLISGRILGRESGKRGTLVVLLTGITSVMLLGLLLNQLLFRKITLNYMLMGVSYSAVFSNMMTDEQLQQLTDWFHPVLGISLLTAIVDLGAPLDYHLIFGAGLYTVVYIVARGAGKYLGARCGAAGTHMPATVQNYLGLTLLPHSGVSLVFTGIICATLSASRPDLAQIVKGTIAAAAVINEIIAVIAAKKGFELAGEMGADT